MSEDMKATVVRIGGAPVTLKEFTDKHGLEMVVKERPRSICEEMPHMSWPDHRFYAMFKDCGKIDGSVWTGICGNGPTPESAVIDYAARIQGLVLGKCTDSERKRYQCPNEWEPSPSPPPWTVSDVDLWVFRFAPRRSTARADE